MTKGSYSTVWQVASKDREKMETIGEGADELEVLHRHPTPSTLHTTHYTLHTTHSTLHTTHYTLHTTHYTPHKKMETIGEVADELEILHLRVDAGQS